MDNNTLNKVNVFQNIFVCMTEFNKEFRASYYYFLPISLRGNLLRYYNKFLNLKYRWIIVAKKL